MALKNCRECGKPVSTQAKACPHCGAKAPKTTSKTAVFFGCVFAVIVATMVFRGGESPAPAVAKPAETPQQVAERNAREAAFQKVVGVLAAIKGAAREPDSISWDFIGANDDASLVCVRYRGRNGFGGVSIEFATYAKGRLSNDAVAWKRNCDHKSLNDLNYAAKAL